MTVPTIKTEQAISIFYIAAFFIFLVVIYRVLSAVGIIKTQKRKKELIARTEAESNLRASAFFDPLFLKGKESEYISLGKNAKNYAALLYKAMHRAGTDEEAIYSTFGRLRSKWDIAEVSLYYRAELKADLLTDILNELTDKEQATLWSIIDKLPNK